MTNDPQDQTVSLYLKAVWRRWQKQHFAAGALACCSWAVPMFLVGMAVDWLTRMPAPGRVVGRSEGSPGPTRYGLIWWPAATHSSGARAGQGRGSGTLGRTVGES